MHTKDDPRLFIFCGEHSGDLHGSKLVQALKKNEPTLEISAVAGPRMRAEGVKSILAMEQFSVMGFTDVLLALPGLIRHFKTVRDFILNERPAAVVLIDYPEFNLLLGKSLKKRGYKGKIVQYISPTVWAWRKKRAYTLSKYFDRLLTIYPFESDYFAHTTLDVRYVGNPTKSRVATHTYNDNWKSACAIDTQAPLIALFPGSRKKEIELNLPKMLSALERLYRESPDFSIAISVGDDKYREQIMLTLAKTMFEVGKNVFLIPCEFTYELMRACELAIAKSGTVTLELALHHKPSVIIFEISRINKLIAKHLLRIRLPFYTIPNILLGRQVFPELIDANISVDELYQHVRAMRCDKHLREKTTTLCRSIDELLTEDNIENNAARAVLELL